MERLSGTDSGFLAMDQEWQPMHNVVLAVLAAHPERAPVTREQLRDHVVARLDDLPRYRQRIVEVPGGWHHPLAVDDPDFDPERHVIHLDGAEVAAHGASVDEVFAALAEVPLPLDRPLWRMYLLDSPGPGFAGIEPGGCAVVLHFHHAIGDGAALMATLPRLFDDVGAPRLAEVPAYHPRALPSQFWLRAAALWHLLVSFVAFLAAVLGAVGGLRRLRARQEVAVVEVPPISHGAPRSLFNEAFSPRRACVRVALPLEGLKQVRTQTGHTLNDVVLAVVSGGLRDYLAQMDALPEEPLLCNVPVSEEGADAPVRTSGNNFWSLTTSLATDVADPLERLARIGEVTQECKIQLAEFGVTTIPTLLDTVPPRLLARGTRRVGERLRTADRVDANVLVSNVRGNPDPFWLFGREVTSLWVCGPPSNGVGLNISVMSYAGRLHLTVLACADALSDPQRLADALGAAYLALVDEVGTAGAASA